jgi:mycofactocin precursor
MSERVATVEAATDIAEAGAGPELADGTAAEPETEVTAADLLVEEVSIDGMCGVY